MSYREHHDDYHRGLDGDVYVDHHDTVGTDLDKIYRITPPRPHTVIEPTIYGDEFDAHYYAPHRHEDPGYYGPAPHYATAVPHKHVTYQDRSDSDTEHSSTDSEAEYADYMHRKHGSYAAHHVYDPPVATTTTTYETLGEPVQRHYHEAQYYDPEERARREQEKRAAKAERKREKEYFKELKEAAKLHETFADEWAMSGHGSSLLAQTERQL